MYKTSLINLPKDKKKKNKIIDDNVIIFIVINQEKHLFDEHFHKRNFQMDEHLLPFHFHDEHLFPIKLYIYIHIYK